MAFTFTINGHKYSSDPNSDAADGYRFVGYGYIAALGNLVQDLMAVVGVAVAAASSATASAQAAAGTQVVATSASAVAVSVGDQTFTVPAGKQFVNNVPVYIVSDGHPDTFMAGRIKSYVGTTLKVTVTSIGIAETRSDWNISVSGLPGPPGAAASNTMFTPVDLGAGTDIPCNQGNNYFKKTVNGPISMTFSSVPTGFSFTLEVALVSGSVAFPASVGISNGLPVSMTVGKTQLFMFVTSNGGVNWKMSVLNNFPG